MANTEIMNKNAHFRIKKIFGFVDTDLNYSRHMSPNNRERIIPSKTMHYCGQNEAQETVNDRLYFTAGSINYK